MAAPTADQVKKLISSQGIEAEIDAAFTDILATTNIVIDGRLVNSGYTTEQLDNIKLWYAAHLVSMSNYRQVKSVGGGGNATTTFTGKFEDGLDATSFGQVVKSLDYKGILAGYEKGNLNGGQIYAV